MYKPSFFKEENKTANTLSQVKYLIGPQNTRPLSTKKFPIPLAGQIKHP